MELKKEKEKKYVQRERKKVESEYILRKIPVKHWMCLGIFIFTLFPSTYDETAAGQSMRRTNSPLIISSIVTYPPIVKYRLRKRFVGFHYRANTGAREERIRFTADLSPGNPQGRCTVAHRESISYETSSGVRQTNTREWTTLNGQTNKINGTKWMVAPAKNAGEKQDARRNEKRAPDRGILLSTTRVTKIEIFFWNSHA